jgi:hypothetical protein
VKKEAPVNSLRSVLLVLVLLSSIAGAAAPNALTIQEATGEAAIVNGNKERAFEEAKEKAIREAVQQVAGVMVSSETLTKNSQLVSDRIYAHSSGYVRNVRVLSQKEEKGVAQVKIRAEIGTAALDKDLRAVQALINRLGNPKLVILTQEHAIDAKGVTTSSGVLSGVLTEGFKKDGWTLIDPNFAAGKVRLQPGVSLGTPEAKEIGELTKADYILYGTVSFRYHPADGPYDKDGQGNQLQFNVTGEYDLALFATDTGSQLTKISGKLTTGDIGQVGSNVISYERTAHDIAANRGASIVAEVRKNALEYLRNAEQNGNRLVMQVNGFREYGSVENFKRVLEGVGGMRDVKRPSFGAGKARFELTFLGTTSELAGKLGGKAFKGRRIDVTGLTPNTVELTLK